MYNWTEYIRYIELGLFLAFCLVALVQFFYYLRFYIPVIKYKSSFSSELYPLSVIICAKNEGVNLKKNLKYVLEQDYPNFEVIVVDDCSTDNTDNIIADYLTKYKNLRTTSIPLDKKFSHGKKLAITIGIKSAKNEHLVFTDADCVPVSKNWLRSIGAGFHRKEIVLGYGGYSHKPTLLNSYIRYDTLTIALNYLGMALAKKTYMGVGRNLAYTKKLFFDNKGFASHYGTLSGDDDLFIGEVSNKENTTIVINSDSFTRSEPELHFNGLFKQKIRHFSTSKHYSKKNSFMVGLEPISRAWFYCLLIILLSFNVFWTPVLAIAGIRMLIQFITYLLAGKKFKEKNIWMTYIIFDIYSLFFNFVTYVTLSLRRKNIRW